MRTDITKINEKTPHQDLTEGLMVFAGGMEALERAFDVVSIDIQKDKEAMA